MNVLKQMLLHAPPSTLHPAWRDGVPLDDISDELAGSLGLFCWRSWAEPWGTQWRKVHIGHWNRQRDRQTEKSWSHSFEEAVNFQNCFWHTTYRCSLYWVSPQGDSSVPLNTEKNWSENKMHVLQVLLPQISLIHMDKSTESRFMLITYCFNATHDGRVSNLHQGWAIGGRYGA